MERNYIFLHSLSNIKASVQKLVSFFQIVTKYWGESFKDCTTFILQNKETLERKNPSCDILEKQWDKRIGFKLRIY